LILLASSAIKTYRLSVKDFPRASQATLHLQACGVMPIEGLLFRFSTADGVPIHEARVGSGGPCETSMLNRIRRLPAMLRIESLVREITRRDVSIHVDLPSGCLAHPALLVSIQNIGRTPVGLGKIRLNTSTLAPGRTLPNLHAIEGYSDNISAAPGESLRLFIHAPRLRFSLRVIRHGAPDQCVLAIDDIAGRPQNYTADAYQRGANWEPGFTLEIGADWCSGMYAARIADDSGASFDITFVVRKRPACAPARLAVLASTNTWQAYNRWGGASLYRYDIDDGLGKTSVCQLHLQRPNPAASMEGKDGHLANAEKHVLGWLDLNEPSYDLYADHDLHTDPALLLQYRTLLINTHSEYWTDEMYAGLEEFLGRGGNLIYLSGNGLFWKTAIRGQQFEVRCDSGQHTIVDEAGGRWRDLGRPETRVLGVRFTRAGYKSRYKPYRVITPDHWIFESTGLRKGSLVGQSGLNMGGASGWEMDKIDPHHQPPGLVHLAKGTNARRSGADMTYFTHPGGGGVFSAGSVTFGGSLAVDAVLGQMVRNVIARFAQDQAPAADVRSLTATPGNATVSASEPLVADR
jgi:hypothetical protein